MEGGKLEYPAKNPWNKDENQQQTQPTYDTESGIQNWATFRHRCRKKLDWFSHSLLAISPDFESFGWDVCQFHFSDGFHIRKTVETRLDPCPTLVRDEHSHHCAITVPSLLPYDPAEAVVIVIMVHHQKIIFLRKPELNFEKAFALQMDSSEKKITYS